MATRVRAQVSPRVALAAEDERTGGEVARVALERGIPVERLSLEAAVDAPVGAIAYAPAQPPDAARAVALARLCAAAAENRRPVILLAVFAAARGRAAEERAAALAYLRAHGAVPFDDPDAWFEAAILVAGFGAPPGPRLAVVAPPGGWLALQALALGDPRALAVQAEVDEDAAPADIALIDGSLDLPAPDRVGRALVVPVVPRAELAVRAERTVLVGLRSAVAAAVAVGRHAQRLAAGLGPQPAAEARKLKVDRAKIERTIAGADGVLGDHETKLLVHAYGVPVIRQAVATSPSAAVRYAEQLGWPVEIKAWDPTVPVEAPGEGTGVIGGLRNPPDVRRAFAAAATGAGLKVGVPVLVRATPPQGRELSARIERHPELGWTVVLAAAGTRAPLAAPAPLRRLDAEDLASVLEASRTGDAPPDRAALAELLQKASLAAVDQEDAIERIELGRVVVREKGGGALLVDGRCLLRRNRGRAR